MNAPLALSTGSVVVAASHHERAGWVVVRRDGLGAKVHPSALVEGFSRHHDPRIREHFVRERGRRIRILGDLPLNLLIGCCIEAAESVHDSPGLS